MGEALSTRAILDFYLDAGVDECIGEEPVDRYVVAPSAPPLAANAVSVKPPGSAQSPASQSPASTQSPALAAPSPAVPMGGDAAVKGAYSLAKEAKTLDDLRAALESFDGCPLKRTATNLVFGDGVAEARIVFIGEAPGAEEDRQGVPFVGASGKLLDRMLASIGLDRGQVFISNTVFWRPPGNRTPTNQETAVCMPFVERLIELIDPQVLVALGGPASKALLAQSAGISRLRGRWFTFATPGLSRPVPATALFHPAYLLRSPAQKRAAWRDLLEIRRKLDAAGDGNPGGK